MRSLQLETEPSRRPWQVLIRDGGRPIRTKRLSRPPIQTSQMPTFTAAKTPSEHCSNVAPELSAHLVEMLARNPIRRRTRTCALVVVAFLPFSFPPPMAAYAVVDIANAFPQVLRSHATWLVFVT